MRYHFVVNGYSKDFIEQMKEMDGFKEMYLTDMEEGEGIIYCGNERQIQKKTIELSEELVLLVGEEQYVPEVILKLLEGQITEEDMYIFGSDYSGTELSVRIAARKKGSSITAVHSVDTQERVNVKKMVYSNHMEGSFWMKKGPYCISLARNLEKKELEARNVSVACVRTFTETESFVVDYKLECEEKKNSLEEAALVVVGGRGVKGISGIETLEEVAGKLGGCVGVSRPAAMNAWAPMQNIVGVSGAMIHPDICIVAGASGAAAFYAGIEKSKCIIAINEDKMAPIMKKADVVIVEDYNLIMEALLEIIQGE